MFRGVLIELMAAYAIVRAVMTAQDNTNNYFRIFYNFVCLLDFRVIINSYGTCFERNFKQILQPINKDYS